MWKKVNNTCKFTPIHVINAQYFILYVYTIQYGTSCFILHLGSLINIGKRRLLFYDDYSDWVLEDPSMFGTQVIFSFQII